MVAAGTHVNSGCCFDFGNAEANSDDNGNGHMDAVNLGTECYFAPCSGTGPWVEADMENGLFSGGNGPNTANAGNGSNFVTAMLKNNGQTTYALQGGDATTGGLSTWWEGACSAGARAEAISRGRGRRGGRRDLPRSPRRGRRGFLRRRRASRSSPRRPGRR
jgi:hypothetical protein